MDRISDFCDRALAALRVVILRRNYSRDLSRIRRLAGGRNPKVAFLVSELSKWKGESLVRALETSGRFDPFVAVMNMTRQARLPEEEQRRLIEEKLAYFRGRGLRVVGIQRIGRKDTRTVEEIDADIVFYQQPWDLPPQMKPTRVSRRALTFYFPYFTPCYLDETLEIDHKLHHQLYGHIVCDERTAEIYRKARTRMSGPYAGDYLALGHPALDAIPFEEGVPDPSGCVIYAPHWSIVHGDHVPPLAYSTFLATGRAILDYAKAHPEVRWAFKPHPLLRTTLVKTGYMTEDEASRYYGDWERIGEACYDGDYPSLFARSRVIVTDCGSFLTEYGCTGKPVIRLVNPDLRIGVQPCIGDLYSTYYNVVTADELRTVLATVVEQGQDPKRAERIACLKRANLAGGDATRRIADYLEKLCFSPQ